MTRQWSGTRVVMAVRRAIRHHCPILQKPLVIPNGVKRNEESHRAKQIFKKWIVIPNESAVRPSNEESFNILKYKSLN
jgi:hypothetical protein